MPRPSLLMAHNILHHFRNPIIRPANTIDSPTPSIMYPRNSKKVRHEQRKHKRVAMLNPTNRHDNETTWATKAIFVSFLDVKTLKNGIKTGFSNIQLPRPYILVQSNPYQAQQCRSLKLMRGIPSQPGPNVDVWYPSSSELTRGMERPYFGDVELVRIFIEAEGRVDSSAIRHRSAETLHCGNPRAKNLVSGSRARSMYDWQLSISSEERRVAWLKYSLRLFERRASTQSMCAIVGCGWKKRDKSFSLIRLVLVVDSSGVWRLVWSTFWSHILGPHRRPIGIVPQSILCKQLPYSLDMKLLGR